MLNMLGGFIDRISRFVAFISGVALVLVALMQVLEILLRNAFGISLPFVWEFASYIHISAVFLAAAYTLRVGGHIRVTLLEKVNSYLYECLSSAVGVVISGYLSYAMVQFAINYGITGRTSGTVNDVPLVYPATMVAFGACLLTLQLILRLIRALGRQPLEITEGKPDAQ
jgi:TRAP-type C4-dicarboxylate transport system permease small subunit